MTDKVVAEVGGPVKVDAAFDAVRSACSLRCIKVVRMAEPRPTILAIELTGATRKWPLYIDCDEARLRLPWVATRSPTTPSRTSAIQGQCASTMVRGCRWTQAAPRKSWHTLL